MRVRPVDPRDTNWEVDTPAYRVYFWSLPPGPPPSSSDEGMGWFSDEYEVEDADVTVVLEWANSIPDERLEAFPLAELTVEEAARTGT